MSGVEAIEESLGSSRQKDPTQSYFGHIHRVADGADAHMLGILNDQAEERREVNSDIISLRTKIQQLDKAVGRVGENPNPTSTATYDPITETFSSGPAASSESNWLSPSQFYDEYRETIQELEEIWGRYQEQFPYAVPNAGDYFLPLSCDHTKVNPQSIKDCIANCNTLAGSLEKVKLPELDMMLTHALELNVILLRAMSKLAEQAAEGTGRTAVRNMGK